MGRILENMKSIDYKIKFANTLLFVIKINKDLQDRRLLEKIILRKIKERIDLAIKNKANPTKSV